MLDVGGFLTSTSFLSALAGFITTILSTLFGSLIAGLFGAS